MLKNAYKRKWWYDDEMNTCTWSQSHQNSFFFVIRFLLIFSLCNIRKWSFYYEKAKLKRKNRKNVRFIKKLFLIGFIVNFTFCLGYCTIAFNENDAFAPNGKAFQLGNSGGVSKSNVRKAKFLFQTWCWVPKFLHVITVKPELTTTSLQQPLFWRPIFHI